VLEVLAVFRIIRVQRKHALKIYGFTFKYRISQFKTGLPVLESNPINWTQTTCDVCRIVHIVASLKHKIIALVGDSVQRQLFYGLACELRRRKFEVSISDHKLWPRRRENEDWKQRGWKYGMRQQFCFNVTAPQWLHYTQHH